MYIFKIVQFHRNDFDATLQLYGRVVNMAIFQFPGLSQHRRPLWACQRYEYLQAFLETHRIYFKIGGKH